MKGKRTCKIKYGDYYNKLSKVIGNDPASDMYQKYGLIYDYAQNDGTIRFHIKDESKFALFMLKYPEYIKEIIPYE